MPVTIQSLASGSAGNTLLVRSPQMTLLIDCGLAPRELQAMLTAADCSPANIDVVFITHEHGDHARGLPLLLTNGCPVVATAGTARALGIPGGLLVHAMPDRELSFGPLSCLPIAVSHDAAEPCGFNIRIDGAHCTVLTDLGMPAHRHSETLAASDLILIEANHDVGMLRAGPYSSRLKARVASSRGHLSNAACAGWLAESLRGASHAPDIWLAHLSQVNNRPRIATGTVMSALNDRGVEAQVHALPRRGIGPSWHSGKRKVGHVIRPLQLPLSFA